jgi:hypothetical protein
LLSITSSTQNNGGFNGKRSVNGAPLQATVETLAVVDYSNFVQHSGYANTSNTSTIILNMRIYFSHLIYAVCMPCRSGSYLPDVFILVFFFKANLRYYNSMRNDPDLRINLTLKAIMIATVSS